MESCFSGYFEETRRKNDGHRNVSWCKDCVKAMPKIKELQANNPDVDYVLFRWIKRQING
jgi:thiol-disulfide isomerase/thioredoxin